MTPSTPTTRWPCSACRAARRSRLITSAFRSTSGVPDWFKQTGDCGYDAPVVPDGTQLGDFQRWLIEVYQASDGWYLFPQWKFMDMAECCMLACVCYAALLLVLLAAWGMRAMKKA